jgi:hypothetical protein
LGIPHIKSNIGGQYLVNKHILENIANNPEEIIFEEEEEEDEFDGIESES